MTRQEYEKEVFELAVDLLQAVDQEEYLEDILDGHEWITYNKHHQPVLDYTQQDDTKLLPLEQVMECFEEGGLVKLRALLAEEAFRRDILRAEDEMPQTFFDQLEDGKWVLPPDVEVPALAELVLNPGVRFSHGGKEYVISYVGRYETWLNAVCLTDMRWER